MRQAYKTAREISLCLRATCVDQLTIFQWRIPAENTTLHRDVYAHPIHVPDLRREVEELRMDGRISRLHGRFLCRIQAEASSQFSWYIVMLEVHNHDLPPGSAQTRVTANSSEFMGRESNRLAIFCSVRFFGLETL